MRTTFDRDLGRAASWLYSDPGQVMELMRRPIPQSIRLWINGLRATAVEPRLVGDGRTVEVDGLEDGDLVTIMYVAAGDAGGA